MKLLALESSGVAASCAILDGDRLLGEEYVNIRQTHSETLMPMVRHLLQTVRTPVSEIGLFAVTAGPGSFTGLRIALAAVKGMAFGTGVGCVAVSTLEALAENLAGTEGVAAAALDARCGQVYGALFQITPGEPPKRLTEDAALSMEAFGGQIASTGRPAILVGDGAALCFAALRDRCPGLLLAPPQLRFQRASAAAFCALRQYERSGATPPEQIAPDYLRLPQAQREWNERLATKQMGGETP